MKKYNHGSWHRSPKTTNEIRQYYAHKDLVKIRGKRSPHNIPNAYDDVRVSIQAKTWKHKRKTQYHNRSEKTKFIIELDSHVSEWILEEYFSKHNIPFRIDAIRETRTNRYYKIIRVPGPLVPQYIYSWNSKKQHQIGWCPAYYKEIKTNEIIEYKYSVCVSYIVTYWANKELDIDKILSRRSY